MEYLPQDPHILVSSINMLLRDEEYDSLESLCYAFGREPQEIKPKELKTGEVLSFSLNIYYISKDIRIQIRNNHLFCFHLLIIINYTPHIYPLK